MHFRFFNKKVLFAIKVCIALLILFVLVKKISISEIYNALQSAAWPYVLFALLLLPVNIFLQYKRWQLLVRLDNVQSRNGEIFLSLLAGMTLGFITPGRVGEYGRCFFIKQGCWPRLLGFIVVEKFISIFFIYLLGIVGFLLLFHQYLSIGVRWLIVAAVCCICCLILYFITHPVLLKRLFLRFQDRFKKHPKIEQFFSSLTRLSKKRIIKLILIVAANVLVYQLQFYFLVNAFHPVDFVNGWAAVASILLAKSFVPISFGDLGVRESASVLLLGRLSVPQAAAFDASLLLFLINIMIPAIAGLYPILRNRSQIHQLEKEPSYD